VGIKLYCDFSQLSFAVGPQKYARKPMPGGKTLWVLPKQYTKFYTDKDELPDLESYLFLPTNHNCKKS
ncbi:hypothetical protein DFH28DRAFT_872607, partial [Melampsora americana]